MHVQHLTILQLKSVFLTEDARAVVVRAGLHPDDARRYGLHPLVAVTLTVQKIGIYWQKVFRADQPIPLAMALHEAWAGCETLHGLPDVLYVDKELLRSFPLRDLLAQIDQDAVIREISADGGRSFSASKREAQKIMVDHHDWDSDADPVVMGSERELLATMNKHVAQYYRFLYVNNLVGEQPTKQLLLHELKQCPVRRPGRPEHWPDLSLEEWIYKPAATVPPMADDQSLFISYRNRWATWAEVGYKTPPEAIAASTAEKGYYPPVKDKGYLWAFECAGLKHTLDALPFPAELLIKETISSDRLKSFLAGREALLEGDALSLERELPRIGLVLMPKSQKAFGEVFDFMSGGGDVRRCCEIVGDPQQPRPFRLFACDSYACGIFLLVVKSESKADGLYLENALNEFIGKIKVGGPAFAAITHFLEHLIVDRPPSNSSVLVDVVDAMLGACPEWDRSPQW